MMKKLVFFVLICAVLTSCASKFSRVLKSKDNEYKYKMAENYYAQKKYSYATQLFDELFPYVKGTPRFEDMHYKNAFAYYYMKDYLNAENLFKSYVDNFPGSPRAEECEYMRAYSFFKQSPKVELDQTPTSKTMGLMQAFINMHPGSAKVKDAAALIDLCRAKLEQKDYKSAELYYNLGFYKAASIVFEILIDDYPDSEKTDLYKSLSIKSYFRYAELSIIEKQEERYEKVLTEITDFKERFPNSKYLKEVNSLKAPSEHSIKFIKDLKDEQAKTATQR